MKKCSAFQNSMRKRENLLDTLPCFAILVIWNKQVDSCVLINISFYIWYDSRYNDFTLLLKYFVALRILCFGEIKFQIMVDWC